MKKFRLDTTKQGVWFTSDTHWQHSNVIRYCNRPFSSVEEMDQALIDNWNARVRPGDFVFHLGDVTWSRDQKDVDALISQLNGTIVHIRGNHDGSAVENCPGFIDHFDLLETKVDNQPIVMCHYAMTTWNRAHYGAWQLYGHSHGSLPDNPNALQIDVGVDIHAYAPISFQEVKELMSKKNFEPIDHHRAET